MRRAQGRGLEPRWWLAALLALSATGPALAEEPKVITIATGPHGGVYLHTGNAICRLVNAGVGRHGLHCLARASPDPVAGVLALQGGERTYAIVPSDVAHRAHAGRGRFAQTGPMGDLRLVLVLQEEPFVALARPDVPARHLDDLRGRRVNLGAEGSIDRELVQALIETLGWSTGDLARTTALDAEASSAALCDGGIDAAFFRVGHPTGWMEDAMRRCGARLVPMTGPALDKLIETTPFLHRTTIDAGGYPGRARDIPVIGLAAVLVTTRDRPDTEVYEVAGAVAKNLGDFSRLHPTLKGLAREHLVDEALEVPLHPGAERYLREAGILR